MKTSTHETLANRLADILIQALSGTKLDSSELAEKYSVSNKTIQRDFHRLSSVLEKCPDSGGYRLTSNSDALFFEKDLVHLVTAFGLKNALPHKTAKFLRDFINRRNSDCYHFQEPPLELAYIESFHSLFEKAISARKTVQFLYKETLREVNPYLMVHSRGAWYLAAESDRQLKTYSFARIKLLTITESTFDFNPETLKYIKSQNSIWFGHPSFEAVLEIMSDIAFFFERKPLLPQQKIVEKRSDGTLIVTVQAQSFTQIAPLIQYWMPRMRVVEPAELNDYIHKNVQAWLTASSENR
ncbi:WYL domain-containing protein [Endozoicomonas sp. 4G]|uniref:helix-turn-helix transcriptional regulator n=1 Tax=Endozoicomonas sp. 4G TaxID=2872754 RepID=UPI0020787814|nr:WYL domain-containing protein [Endozoicomonas sp. 4G]